MRLDGRIIFFLSSDGPVGVDVAAIKGLERKLAGRVLCLT